jgi:hypothetical protein
MFYNLGAWSGRRHKSQPCVDYVRGEHSWEQRTEHGADYVEGLIIVYRTSSFIMIAGLVVMWYSLPRLYALPPEIARTAAALYVPLLHMYLPSIVLQGACSAANTICRTPAKKRSSWCYRLTFESVGHDCTDPERALWGFASQGQLHVQIFPVSTSEQCTE